MAAILIITVAWFASENDVPLGGAVFMTVLVLIGGMLHSTGFTDTLLWSAFTFVYCLVYFYLLNRCKDTIVAWLLVLFAGGVGWFLIPLTLAQQPAL